MTAAVPDAPRADRAKAWGAGLPRAEHVLLAAAAILLAALWLMA